MLDLLAAAFLTLATDAHPCPERSIPELNHPLFDCAAIARADEAYLAIVGEGGPFATEFMILLYDHDVWSLIVFGKRNNRLDANDSFSGVIETRYVYSELNEKRADRIKKVLSQINVGGVAEAENQQAAAQDIICIDNYPIRILSRTAEGSIFDRHDSCFGDRTVVNDYAKTLRSLVYKIDPEMKEGYLRRFGRNE